MAGLIPNRIALPLMHKDQMVAHAIKTSPLECCGILAGTSGIATQVFPIPNINPRPNGFTMNPPDLVETFHRIDRLGLQVVGMFHSHPHSDPIPSETDVDNCFYPEIPQFIIGKNGDNWDVRSFMIRNSGYVEIDIDLISG